MYETGFSLPLEMPALIDKRALRGISQYPFALRVEHFVGASHCFCVTNETSRLLRAQFGIAFASLSKLALRAGCLSRNELRDDFADRAG